MIELLLEAERALSFGMLDQADRLYRQAADADPRNSIAVVGLARVAIERGDEEEALRQGERALEIDGENQAARRLVARLREVREYREAAGRAGQRDASAPPSAAVSAAAADAEPAAAGSPASSGEGLIAASEAGATSVDPDVPAPALETPLDAPIPAEDAVPMPETAPGAPAPDAAPPNPPTPAAAAVALDVRPSEAPPVALAPAADAPPPGGPPTPPADVPESERSPRPGFLRRLFGRK